MLCKSRVVELRKNRALRISRCSGVSAASFTAAF
jgi:hypothetical protein